MIGSCEEKSFKYIGLGLNTLKNGISLDQVNYINSIETVRMSRQRATERKCPLTDTVREWYRSVIGQLNWVAGHTRPDIAFEVCQLSVGFNSACVEDLLRLNKVVKYLKQK